MKQIVTASVIVLFVCVCLTTAFKCRADEPEDDAGTDNQALSTEDLEVLAAPIALYPDVLIAQVLPAATFPPEVTLAARWVRAHPDLAGLDDQSWDPPVKAVARFPAVIQMLDDNLESTIALGDAFVNQQADLMDAIQQLRAKFRADGSLVDTDQQRVVMDDNAIQIEPVDPQVIYVPCYTPIVDYGDEGADFSIGPLTFGVEIGIGDWLDLDFDWHRHHVFFGHYGSHGEWDENGGRMWSHPHFVRHNYNVDVRNIKNVNIRHAENSRSRKITNTNVRTVKNTTIRNNGKTDVITPGKTKVRNNGKTDVITPGKTKVKNTNNENITRRADSTNNKGNLGRNTYTLGTTVKQEGVRGQNSRNNANLTKTRTVKTPTTVSKTPTTTAKTSTTSKPPVNKGAGPGAFKVSNTAATSAASTRGAASRGSAGASSSGTAKRK